MGAVMAALTVAGCAPILNIEGTFFPAWMMCLALGIVLTVVVRQLLVVLHLEPHLGPPLLIWPALGLLLTMLTWLVLYRT
jgi:hypothetical protein